MDHTFSSYVNERKHPIKCKNKKEFPMTDLTDFWDKKIKFENQFIINYYKLILKIYMYIQFWFYWTWQILIKILNCRIRNENENPDQELHEIQESIEQELAANVNDQSVIKRAFVTPTVRRALVLGKIFKMDTETCWFFN